MLKTVIKPMLIGFLCTVSLAACTAAGPIDNRSSGALIGGVVGGAACANLGGGRGRIAAAIACTLAGAFIGGAIGNNMDETDQIKTQQAITQTPTNETVSWYNPKSEIEYKITPTAHPKIDNSGRTCREFSTTAIIASKSEIIYGTACQQTDGSWEMSNQ